MGLEETLLIEFSEACKFITGCPAAGGTSQVLVGNIIVAQVMDLILAVREEMEELDSDVPVLL